MHPMKYGNEYTTAKRMFDKWGERGLCNGRILATEIKPKEHHEKSNQGDNSNYYMRSCFS
jgi:hypothetical protein